MRYQTVTAIAEVAATQAIITILASDGSIYWTNLIDHGYSYNQSRSATMNMLSYMTGEGIVSRHNRSWYNRACARVKRGDIDNALVDLKEALEIDKEGYIELAKQEKDFEGIRDDDRFKKLISS